MATTNPPSLTVAGQIEHHTRTIYEVAERIRVVLLQQFDRYKPDDLDHLKHVDLGEPSVIPDFPAVSIKPNDVTYTDMPQDAGYEVRANFILTFYSHKQDSRKNSILQMKLADTIRDVFKFRRSLKSRDTEKLVYQAIVTSINFGTLIISTYQGEEIGIYGGILNLDVLWHETRA